MTDAERLDWLESQLRPRVGYVEVYLAGLRCGDAEASAFQVELQGQAASTAMTLRAAIDAAALQRAGLSLWECLACARVVDLSADDYCPICGVELPDPCPPAACEVLPANPPVVFLHTRAAPPGIATA